MAVNTVYSKEIHPRTLWMTLGASVHWLHFWQLRAGSSKILLNMETHAVLAERQWSNTLSKGRFREGINRKAHAYSQKQPILSHSALEIGKNNTVFPCFILHSWWNFPHQSCRYKYSYIIHDSWWRAFSLKHIGLIWRTFAKKWVFFNLTITMTFL